MTDKSEATRPLVAKADADPVKKKPAAKKAERSKE